MYRYIRLYQYQTLCTVFSDSGVEKTFNIHIHRHTDGQRVVEGKGGQQVLHPLNVFEQVYRLLAHRLSVGEPKEDGEMGISNGELESLQPFSQVIQPEAVSLSKVVQPAGLVSRLSAFD